MTGAESAHDQTPATGPATVVITGAARGIGRATALRFARRRWNLVLVDLEAGPLEAVADEARRAGAQRVAVVDGDVARAETHELAAELASTIGGRPPAVWVNNAGVGALGRLPDLPERVLGNIVSTNVLGTMLGARAALAAFEPAGHGVLIDVASIAGEAALPLQAPYAATKAAIRSLDRTLRVEFTDPGIRISTILPGPVRTPFWEHMPNHTGRAERALQPAISADRVAAAIERCADRPRAVMRVGMVARTLGALHRLAPGLTDRLIGRVMPPLVIDPRVVDERGERSEPVRTLTDAGVIAEALHRQTATPPEASP